MKVLLDAGDLQREPYRLSRHGAYSVLHEIGVRPTPRRLVVHVDALEQFLRGGERVNGERHPDKEQAPGSAAASSRA